MRMSSSIVEKLGDIIIGRRCGFRAYSRQRIKCRKHGGIYGSCVENKGADDLLNAGFARRI